MNQKPKIFIGSSSESLDIAHALEYELQNVARTEVWDSAFRPGHYTLSELSLKAQEVDFAAFILGQEDKTESRDEVKLSPRDNVVYEAGLFAGRLGVPRVFLLVDERGIKIPTDWKGLGYIPYNPIAEDKKDVVHSAAVRIRKEISDWVANEKLSIDKKITGHWWQYVTSRNDNSVISFLKIDSSEGLKVEGKSWTSNGENIAVYWSNAAALDERDARLFYYWAGKHPYDEKVPEFFGVGEIQFKDFKNTLIEKGDGWYSVTPLINLDETVRNATIYMRAKPEETQVIDGNDRAALKKLIDEKVKDRKDILGL